MIWVIVYLAAVAVIALMAYEFGYDAGFDRARFEAELGDWKPGGVCPDLRVDGEAVTGCDFETAEIWENVTVEVLRCRRCDAVDVGWRKQPDSVCKYRKEDEE